MQKNGCNGNVNIDVNARKWGPQKDLPGLLNYLLFVVWLI